MNAKYFCKIVFVFAISYFFPPLSTVILNLEAVVPWLSCLSDISKLMNGKIMSRKATELQLLNLK